MRGQDLDARHLRELEQHLFLVDRCEKEPVDLDILDCPQSIFRLLHRHAVGNLHLVARVLRATRDVDRFFGWKGIAKDYQASFAMRGGSSYLLRVLEAADVDATKPQSDLADQFRG